MKKDILIIILVLATILFTGCKKKPVAGETNTAKQPIRIPSKQMPEEVAPKPAESKQSLDKDKQIPDDGKQLFAHGKIFFDQENYSKALASFKKAAELGHAEAMNNLGFIYDQGVGIIYDSDKAKNWYSKAAEAGSPTAMLNLALIHSNGDERDIVKAVKYFEKASKKINPENMYEDSLVSPVEKLDLSKSSISNINALCKINGIKKLNLAGCGKITNIDSLYHLNTLVDLNLSSCGAIKDFRALSGMKNLELLDLSSTKIDKTKPIQSLENVKELNVNYTKMSNFEFLQNFHKLERLSVSELEINVKYLKDLKSLDYLQAFGSTLKNWVYLKNLKQLKTLYISNSTLDSPQSLDFVLNIKSLEYVELEHLYVDIHGGWWHEDDFLIQELKRLKNNIPKCEIHSEIRDQSLYDFLRQPR